MSGLPYSVNVTNHSNSPEVQEEVEIQDVTGIFDVLFSSCTVYSYAFRKIMDKWTDGIKNQGKSYHPLF